MNVLSKGLEDICRRYRVISLYVFGSRAQEVAKRVRGGGISESSPSLSDVDIGLLPVKGEAFEVRDKVRFAAELEDLLMVSRVDLVVLPEASAFLALDVIRGELLYERDFDVTSEFELYVLRRAGDLVPFERYRRQEVLYGGGS